MIFIVEIGCAIGQTLSAREIVNICKLVTSEDSLSWPREIKLNPGEYHPFRTMLQGAVSLNMT